MRRKTDKQITFQLSRDLHDKVRELAQREGEAVSTLTRSLLKDAVEKSARGETILRMTVR
jgi:hypothetical protein